MMIRRGHWKYIYYVGYEPELFNLQSDPEELVNIATEPNNSTVLASLHKELLNICEPGAVNDMAHADQAALIARVGGREKALKLGAPGATPPPS